jgi:hypothetical protein
MGCLRNEHDIGSGPMESCRLGEVGNRCFMRAGEPRDPESEMSR